MAQQFLSSRFRSTLDPGTPNAGGRLYTYASGTTTHKDAFTDATLTVPCTYVADTNGHLYIALDARGEAQVWLGSGAYTMIDTTPTGVQIDSVDGVEDPEAVAAAGLAAFIANLAAVNDPAKGGGMVGLYSGAEQVFWNAANMYDLALEEGAIINPIKGADPTGAADSAAEFNAVLLRVGLAGGGAARPSPGTYKLLSPALVPNNVVLDLTGVILTGAGPGIGDLVRSGAIVSGALIDITLEYGTGAQGAGEHYSSGRIINGTFRNAATGIRGHRMNYGARISGNVFEATLTNAWVTTHSFGLKVVENTAYAPAIMKDFVDFTRVECNKFEGPGSTDGTAGLTITTGGYGGSYSLAIAGNGVHHWTSGIVFSCEGSNTIIEGNHFEDDQFLISGDASTRSCFSIRCNWMKANLGIAASDVIAISFLALSNSEIGPNFISTDGSSAFAAYYVLNTVACFGNDIFIPYDPSSTYDLTMYQIATGNYIHALGGSTNPSLAQPQSLLFSGSNKLTIEQYVHTYNDVANQMPNCTVVYSGTTITITTFIPADSHGARHAAFYDWCVNGTTSYTLMGMVRDLKVLPQMNEQRGGGTGLTLTVAGVSGALVFTLTGAPAGGNVTGKVKQL